MSQTIKQSTRLFTFEFLNVDQYIKPNYLFFFTIELPPQGLKEFTSISPVALTGNWFFFQTKKGLATLL